MGDVVAPWFHARRSGDLVRTSGTHSASFGHRLPRAEGDDDGVYAEWSWDGTRLSVRNDRYGYWPLYVWASDDEVGVSPSIPTLLDLGASRELDEDALSVFVRLGLWMAEDTPFRAIRALPPRATFTWEPGRLSVSGGLPPHRQETISRAAAIDAYIELFRAAIERRPPTGSGFSMPLSGGRDSRHILFELMRQGHQPSACLTTLPFPPKPQSDVEIAAKLCATLGLPHVPLERPASVLAAEVRKNDLTGFCTDQHAWYLPVSDALRSSTTCSYDGIAGDVLAAGLFLSPGKLRMLASGDVKRFSRHLLGVHATREAPLVHLLRPAARRRLSRRRAVERLSTEAARHVGAANPVSSFLFWNRTRRVIALSPFALCAGVTIHSPYLDHDLFDLVSALPGEFFLGHAFHDDVIRAAFPEHASIPYATTTHVPATRAYLRRASAEIARFVLRNATGRWLDRGLVLRNLGRSTLTGGAWLSVGKRLPRLVLMTQLEGLE